MIALAVRPSSVPWATLYRRMSPVEICGIKYRSMMRLACVPLPAPGGPSRTTGPTSREVSCAISWPKPPESSVQQPHKPGRRCLQRLAAAGRGVASYVSTTSLRPIAAAANASAARREAIVMAHDELRLDLRHRIHGHAH